MDGVVFQIKARVKDLQAGLHYLLLLRLKFLASHYVYLKKHWDLSHTLDAGLKVLRHACGNTIAHVDSGYALTLSVVPASVQSADHCRDHHADFEIYHETFPTPFPDTVEGAACQVPPSARMRRRTSHSFMYLEGSKPLSFLFWSRPW